MGHSVGIDDDEVQTEFLTHLVAPLQGKARRTDNYDRTGPVAQEKLFDDEPRLDGFTEADIVSQQEVGARSLECPSQRLKLVRLQGRP